MDALEQATQLISDLQQKNDDLQLELDVANGLRSTSTPRALARTADVTQAAATAALRAGLRIQRREYQAFLAQKVRAAKAQQDRLMLSMHRKFKAQIEAMARQQRTERQRARTGSSTGSLGLGLPADVAGGSGGGGGGVARRRSRGGSVTEDGGGGGGGSGSLGLPLAGELGGGGGSSGGGGGGDDDDGNAAHAQLAEQARVIADLRRKLKDAEANTKRVQDNAESLCGQLTGTASALQATEAKLRALEEQHAKLVRWQIVDCAAFRARGQATVYDARIQEVLKAWTPDEQRIARLTSWLDGVTRGKVSDSTFPRRIELLAMSQRAASGFLTKVVPLLAIHVDLTIALRPSHGQTLDVDSFMRFCAAEQAAGGVAGGVGAGGGGGGLFSRRSSPRSSAASPKTEAAAALLQLKLDLRFVVIGASATAPSKASGSIGLDI